MKPAFTLGLKLAAVLCLLYTSAASAQVTAISAAPMATSWNVSTAGYPYLDIMPQTTAALRDFFSKVGHPQVFPPAADQTFLPLVLESLPADYKQKLRVSERKALFIAILMPKILLTNVEIAADRAFIERMRGAPAEALLKDNALRLAGLFDRYKVTSGSYDDLLERVDILPPALVVGQAVMEGGWGMSRFAREANALFGLKSGASRTNAIPSGPCRASVEQCYRSFSSLTDSVAAYMHVLNTHKAYRSLRAHRSGQRRQGATLSAHTLADGLLSFSERGSAYIADLKKMIRSNNLERLDSARLGFVPTIAF